MLISRSPTKADKVRFAQLQEMGCIVCRLYLEVYSPPEIHHIAGKTKAGAHQKTIPLCFRHHREGADCDKYTSRHPHKLRFEERYGREITLLQAVNEHLEKQI